MIDLDGENAVLKPTLFRNACSKCKQSIHFEKQKREFICTRCKFYDREFYVIAKALKLNGKCFICGTKEKLAVHHKDLNKKNNKLTNLMVLCNQCHRSFHGHNLTMPKEVRWGKFGKRLIY